MKLVYTLLCFLLGFGGLNAQESNSENGPYSRFMGASRGAEAKISGTIQANGVGSDSVWVSVFRESSPNKLQFVKATQTENGTGSFTIENIDEGTYYLSAEPMIYSLRQQFALTYYGDSAVWSLSKAIYIQGNVTGKNIHLTPIRSTGGIENLEGEIMFSENVPGYNFGDPVVNHNILVYNKNNELLAIEKSDGSGKFHFSNLPNEELRFIANTPGKTSKSIQLNPANENNQLKFWVSATDSYGENVALSTVEIESKNTYTYPNPAHQKLFIQNQNEFHKVLIYSLSGQLITSQNITIGLNSIDISNIQPGTYVLVLVGKSELETKPIVIE